MTVIEMETLNAIKNACHEYTKSKKIDWEKRRYEIAKDVLTSVINDDTTSNIEKISFSVKMADALIYELKKNKEQIKIG